jgi:transporter family protein
LGFLGDGSLKSALFIVICIVCWGLWAFFPKLATRYLSPMDALLYEIAAVVAVAAAILAIARPRMKVDSSSAIAFLAGSIGSGGFLLYLLAVARHDASIVAPITALYPVVPVILGFFLLREKLSPLNYAGMALAVVAVILLSV